MRRLALIGGTISCCALTACGPLGSSGVDGNLECSAMISAAHALVRSGKAQADPDMMKRAYGSSMLYLNAYAIPKRLAEAKAFEEVKARRATLIETLSPADIVSRAKACVVRSPG